LLSSSVVLDLEDECGLTMGGKVWVELKAVNLALALESCHVIQLAGKVDVDQSCSPTRYTTAQDVLDGAVSNLWYDPRYSWKFD
jgi:hypothetical protein